MVAHRWFDVIVRSDGRARTDQAVGTAKCTHVVVPYALDPHNALLRHIARNVVRCRGRAING